MKPFLLTFRIVGILCFFSSSSFAGCLITYQLSNNPFSFSARFVNSQFNLSRHHTFIQARNLIEEIEAGYTGENVRVAYKDFITNTDKKDSRMRALTYRASLPLEKFMSVLRSLNSSDLLCSSHFYPKARFLGESGVAGGVMNTVFDIYGLRGRIQLFLQQYQNFFGLRLEHDECYDKLIAARYKISAKDPQGSISHEHPEKYDELLRAEGVTCDTTGL